MRKSPFLSCPHSVYKSPPVLTLWHLTRREDSRRRIDLVCVIRGLDNFRKLTDTFQHGEGFVTLEVFSRRDAR